MTGTGLLTARCDPYGAESRIQLMGGLYSDAHLGKIMWHCEKRAQARYRMVCQGGQYGTRTTADGGTVAGYVCDGGHQGQVMALCAEHRQEIGRRQAGLCPACAWPGEARTLHERIEDVQRQLQSPWAAMNLALYARLNLEHDDLANRMTELQATGSIHKCPLRLTEVS